MDGKIEGMIHTKFEKYDGEFTGFKLCNTSEEAADKWMDGDYAAIQSASEQCRTLTDHWMVWVQVQSCEMPAAIRFDYMVKRSGPGTANVWTLEICELGFSCIRQQSLPEKVFASMVKSCLQEVI